MFELAQEIFGKGKDLTVLQMSARALVMFFVCLILIRFAGRRAFGIHTPLDNVLGILLGAILSRAVTGASPFLPIIAAGATIAVLHRIFAWLGLYSKLLGRMVKGEAMVLYENGKLDRKNMRACCITEKDIMEGLREYANVSSYDEVKTIYAERNGKISVVKK